MHYARYHPFPTRVRDMSIREMLMSLTLPKAKRFRALCTRPRAAGPVPPDPGRWTPHSRTRALSLIHI